MITLDVTGYEMVFVRIPAADTFEVYEGYWCDLCDEFEGCGSHDNFILDQLPEVVDLIMASGFQNMTIDFCYGGDVVYLYFHNMPDLPAHF